ncbi:MAG: DUF4430 domain-containing protein [Oscillospiraceae bacterium]|nr:DUF4430 domain-containing protein [Oscillospiraceae bacterium]
MWWKNNKWKIIVPLLIAAILAAAFWYGGDAPSLRGWTAESAAAEAQPTESAAVAVDEPEDIAAAEMPAAAQPTAAPQEDAPAATPTPSAEPEPTPTPAPEPTETAADSGVYTCTLSISCAALLQHMDWLDSEKAELVPSDGWILPPTEVTFYEGESVFDVLLRTCTENKIHLEFSETPLYASAYIEGIANLYEFDCGELSGWMYKVNETFPNFGCSRYALSDGDTVSWLYTCDLGADIGGSNFAGGE